MIKISIVGVEVNVKAVKGDNVKQFALKGGRFKEKEYNFLIISGKSLFLENSTDVTALISDAEAIYLTTVTPLDKLAEIKGEEVYFKGIDTVREGEEREILRKIISLS